MNFQSTNLNIHYSAGSEIWDKIPSIYERMDGWLGFGKGGNAGEEGIPYWFSYDETEKHISASVEPSGLSFTGLMENQEWELWISKIKSISSEILGFEVIEPEIGS
jgi:hypothetical protein